MIIFSNLKHNTIRLVSQVERIQKLIDDGKLKAFQVNVSMDNWEGGRSIPDIECWETIW